MTGTPSDVRARAIPEMRTDRTGPGLRPGNVLDLRYETGQTLRTLARTRNGGGPLLSAAAGGAGTLGEPERLSALFLVLGDLAGCTAAAAILMQTVDPDLDSDDDITGKVEAAFAPTLGALTAGQAAVLSSAVYARPRRSRAVAAAGGHNAAMAACRAVLDRLERTHPHYAAWVAQELVHTTAGPPASEHPAGTHAREMVQWWCAAHPEAPARLDSSRTETVVCTFEPAPAVTVSAQLPYVWPPSVPEVVTGASMAEAIRGAILTHPRPGSPERRRTLDVGALHSGSGLVPRLVGHHGSLVPLARYTVPKLQELLAAADPDLVPPAIVRAARQLRPWVSARDQVRLLDDPDDNVRILAGEKVAIAATR